jgi:hypothetical protein
MHSAASAGVAMPPAAKFGTGSLPVSADPDQLRDGGIGGHQDFRGGADDGGIAVMLGHPEPLVAEALAELGERDGVTDG